MSEHKYYPLTWDHYGVLIEDLWSDLDKKIRQNNITVDAIIAILREGVFTAMPLAYKLNTYKVLTIQYKYMLYEGSNELKQITGLSEPGFAVPEKPVFLLCDTFPCGGETKFLAVEEKK